MTPGPYRSLRSPVLLLVASSLAVVMRAAPAWVLVPCVAWLGAVALGGWLARRRDPRSWPGAVCRGVHPGCCAVIVEVRAGQETVAMALLGALAERRIPVAVFTGPGVSLPVASTGVLLGPVRQPPASVRHAYWRPLGARPDGPATGVLVGHSLSLGPRSTDDDAARVVATDLVLLHPAVPPTRALQWVDEWVARAVAPAPLHEVLATSAPQPPAAAAPATRPP